MTSFRVSFMKYLLIAVIFSLSGCLPVRNNAALEASTDIGATASAAIEKITQIFGSPSMSGPTGSAMFYGKDSQSNLPCSLQVYLDGKKSAYLALSIDNAQTRSTATLAYNLLSNGDSNVSTQTGDGKRQLDIVNTYIAHDNEEHQKFLQNLEAKIAANNGAYDVMLSNKQVAPYKLSCVGLKLKL